MPSFRGTFSTNAITHGHGTDTRTEQRLLYSFFDLAFEAEGIALPDGAGVCAFFDFRDWCLGRTKGGGFCITSASFSFGFFDNYCAYGTLSSPSYSHSLYGFAYPKVVKNSRAESVGKEACVSSR